MKFKIKNLKFSLGFTLIEMLVTLGIITALSAMILGYSRQSEKTTYLVREGNRIVFELRRAQSQAMLMLQHDFGEDKKVCAWGIYIGPAPQEQFLLFADLCEAGESNGNGRYDDGEKVEKISLLKSVEIFESNISSIVFIPPEPKIKFDPDLGGGTNAYIKIQLKNRPGAYYEIQISEVGQIYKELKGD